MADPTILYDSIHEPKGFGHGGNHRSLQIVELIERAGYRVQLLPQDVPSGRRRAVLGVSSALRHTPPSIANALRAVRISSAYGGEKSRLDRALGGYSGRPVLVWESTRKRMLAELARAAGLRVIAVPQNFESFIDQQVDRVTGESLPASFEHELRALAGADAVFTISREEQWLLGARNVPSDYLPYYPPSAVAEDMMQVRAARRPGDRFLVLGSASNPPTRQGMTAQLRMLTPLCTKHGIAIDVAGRGTGTIAMDVSDACFTYHDQVSAEALRALLSTTRAVLVHQTSATGALTRIPEMLVAGVPVVCNPIAARSAFTLDGVHCYESLDELVELMHSALPTPPIPARPEAAERRFAQRLEA